jgi:NAD(P)-dependent dehydrogenase (short-subunit alcohol dehydrogenase family)
MHNPFSLSGKTIFITGASSGIGKAVAIECSKMGAKLIISGRNKERLAETVKMMEGDNHQQIVCDLQTDDGIGMVVENLPVVDGIVHCAGIVKPTPFTFASQSNVDEIMGINFISPLQISRQLLKQKKIRHEGSIVFISSISGTLCSYVGNSIYSASKGAINGLIKGMALDLAPNKIRVNSVIPGMVKTNFLSGEEFTEDQLQEDMKRYPLKRYGRPEEIAYAVIYLLSDASSWVTGSNLLIDGGFTLL